MVPARAFAGVVDWRDPPDDGGLVAALAPDGPARTLVADGLALAWTGLEDPVVDDERVLLLDGDVYAVAGATEGPVGVGELAVLHHRLGDDLFPRLRADAVVVVHDRRRRRLVIARDQLGGRSVVWHRSGSRVRFASEVVHLLALLPSRPAPDAVSMAHWLAPSGPPGDRTMHEGVHRLPRGHLLAVDADGPVARRYWFPGYRRPERLSVGDAAAGLRAHLTRSVERRSTVGATTGVLLSGGLDSSSVAAVASTLDADRRPQVAYSATFPLHPTIDETELIDLTCRSLGLRSTRAVVTSGSVLAGALPYIERWCLPPVSPNLFFWLPLFDRVRADGTTALLDGEGGDELFGLSPFLLSDRLRHGRLRDAAGLVRRIPGGGPHLPRSTIRQWLRGFGLKGLVPLPVHRAVRRARGPGRYAPTWIRPDVVRHFLAEDLESAWKANRGPRWWAYLVDAVTSGAASTLAYDHIRRRASMAGLAARHPLVDVDVVTYALGLDPELAFDHRWSRPVFREAVAGILPDPVRLRPAKSTFNASFQEALTGPDLAVARELLGADAEVAAYADLDVARAELLDAVPPPGQRDWWSLHLWRLLTAECWLRNEAGRLVHQPWHELLAPPVLDLRTSGP